MRVKINGIEYQTKHQPGKQQPNNSLNGIMSIMLTYMLAGEINRTSRREPLYSAEYLAEEFGRIQRKESQLSRRERDHITFLFNKTFEPIKQ